MSLCVSFRNLKLLKEFSQGAAVEAELKHGNGIGPRPTKAAANGWIPARLN